MLGLKGIENTRMFRELKLKAKSKNQIISFTKNPSEKSISNVLSDLVGYIKREQVVSLNVRNRKPPYAKVRHRVHPWYLREYNRRWYLFGFDVGESKIMHYALDRIDHRIGELKSVEYKKPQVSVEDILQDCIGVSIHNDTEPMEIIFWVSDESADFVSNKPLHSSQEEIKIEDHPEVDVRTSLDGGKYFKIFCRDSYELQRELTSFGPELIVLSPEPLRANIKDKLERMIKNYT
jgi:predicted DNA-binding transcriptional regulator YafY